MSAVATFDALARVLAEAQQRFGEAAFRDRRRLIGLLADHVPEAKREIRAVGTAVDEGVPSALVRAERHLIGMEMDRQAERLEATTGLRIDLARPVVQAFAYGLGLGPLPSIYVSAAEPLPTPPATSWSGLSQPVVANARPETAAQGLAAVSRPAPPTMTIAGRSVPRHHIIIAAVGLAAVLIVPALIGKSGEDGAATAPTVGAQDATAAPSPDATAAVPPAPPPAAGKEGEITDRNYAEESNDFGVPQQTALQDNVGRETPLGIPVGRRVTTSELQRLLQSDPATLLIDVLDAPHDATIKSARFMPGLGNGGTLSDSTQTRLERSLGAATGNDRTRKLVFFCYGSRCWESYNAVLRAAAARYPNAYWYRGGLSAWRAAGLPMEGTPTPSG